MPSIEVEVYYTAGAWHWRRMDYVAGSVLDQSAGTFESAVDARTAALVAHPGSTVTPFFAAETRRYPKGW